MKIIYFTSTYVKNRIFFQWKEKNYQLHELNLSFFKKKFRLWQNVVI
jgi:hypothetical protein